MKSINKYVVAGIACFITAVFATQAYPHHSFAMYDMKSEKLFTGKIFRFIPGANHAQILFTLLDVDGAPILDDKGEPVIWGVETGPAARIAEQGVTVKSFPVDSILTVALHPLRNGRNFGVLADAGIVFCGNEWPANGCTAETGKIFLAQ